MQIPHDQLGSFLDTAPDAIVIVDSLGTIAFFNVQAEALFEYHREELIGHSLEVLLPERFRNRHAEQLLGYFVAPRYRYLGAHLDLLARRKDGSEFPVEISLSPVSTDNGMFVSSAIRDVTARKGFERRLVEARELAEHANRAKSAFLAAASHDLRQPLQTLTLLSGVLACTVPARSAAATAIASQAEALRLMAELLNSLLDVSKLDAGVIKPDVTDFGVGEIFARLRVEFDILAQAKGLDLHVEACDDVVRSDPTLLLRMIQNLLANAIRNTRRGWVRLRGLVLGDTLRIEVADTGVGIPADELDLIFDEFYQGAHSTRDVRDGMGLGLSIVRRIAGLLDCTVDVESSVGEGSCFAVNVPRAGASASRFEDAGREEAADPTGALVLVIDDDAAVADATAMLLGATGFEVLVASGSEEGLRRIDEHGRVPALLICDYHLAATENGIDAIRAIRAATAQTLPSILLSGDTSAAVDESVRAIGRCATLRKPVDVDELLQRSHTLLKLDAYPAT